MAEARWTRALERDRRGQGTWEARGPQKEVWILF